jgi:hypothetical protein
MSDVAEVVDIANDLEDHPMAVQQIVAVTDGQPPAIA